MVRGMNSWLPSHLTLRFLEEYDADTKQYVARCLETGTVATGDTEDSAHALLIQTIQLEAAAVSRALRESALFEKPAGAVYELRWQKGEGAKVCRIDAICSQKEECYGMAAD